MGDIKWIKKMHRRLKEQNSVFFLKYMIGTYISVCEEGKQNKKAPWLYNITKCSKRLLKSNIVCDSLIQ